MSIYDGNKLDTTDRFADKFLQINSCGFQNIVSEHTVIRKIGRKDYHILLVSNGTCRVWHNKKSHELTIGNFVIYAPGEEQKYTFQSGSTSLWCHFGGTAIREIFDTHGIKSGVYFYKPNKNILNAFTDTIRNFHQPSRTKFANASLLELLYFISDGIENVEENKSNDAILNVLTYINLNYNKQITLDELARKSGYSKSRFSHIFAEIAGTTPIKYQNEIRLKTAHEMLSSTNLSIKEIAFSCGFGDALYFSRLFAKKYGVPPSKLRSTMQK